MALFRDDAGKTEPPTPQKLGDARDRGQAPVSREFTTAGALLAAVVALQLLGPWMAAAFEAVLREGMALSRAALESGEPQRIGDQIVAMLLLVAPAAAALVAVFVMATAACGYGQIGLQLSNKALGIKLERLSPAQNAKRLFSFASVARAVMALLKIGIIASVLAAVLHNEWHTLAALHHVADLPTAVGEVMRIAIEGFAWVAGVVLVLALADIAWQRFDYRRNLRMSKSEVDDERKRTEGDPLIKNRLRAARQQLMKHRMMAAIAKADVVITNPTHFAVALRYDRGRQDAPELVAKGTDEVAQRIRELAREHRVPIMEDPPLARALCRSVKVGQQIPEQFFKAVAAVLSHIYRLGGQVA